MTYFADLPDVLGAYDEQKYRDYQEAVRTGRGWIPNDVLEDPNGGLIYFNEAGEQDHYQPAARPTGPTDNLPATKDSQSPFYGWTMYEAAAFNTARGATGIHTDFLLRQPKPWSAADLAENDRRLREFAETNPKVQAALQQAATGPFRGTFRQAEFEENERIAIENAAQELLSDWLAARNDAIARGRGFPWTIPLMPEPWFYGTDVTAPVLARLRELVAQLPPAPTEPPPPPPPPPAPTPSSSSSSAPAPTSSSAAANYPVAAPAMPSDVTAAASRPVVSAAPAPADNTKWLIAGGIAAGLGLLALAAGRSKKS